MSLAVAEVYPRIGVFLCHCGSNIAGVVDVGGVAEYARGLPGVVHVDEHLHSCSSKGLADLKEAVRKQKLERVVVASCTPRTHEPLFREACEEAGLNGYLFQMINIREQDAWVHAHDRRAATEKAKILTRMAVAKARFLEPEHEVEVDVEPTTLVVGGGISGMTAALSLANQGFRVHLVEREAELGGVLRDLHTLYPTGQAAQDLLRPLVDAVAGSERIRLHTSTVVSEVKGFIGNFDVKLLAGNGGAANLKAGTIIVATGAEALTPAGRHGYGESGATATQLELERRLREGVLETPRRVVMIQCVGAREAEGRTYCSRICCGVALKNALLLKDLRPDTEVHILYRDLQAYGVELEEYYREALERGIRFVNYTQDRPPRVSTRQDGTPRVEVFDTMVGTEIELNPDLLVLSTPLIPREEGKALARTLRVPLGPDEFFLEAHPKLRPVDFSSEGIYLCGTAHGPKGVAESVAQAHAAASRAAIPMARRAIRSEAVTAVVNRELCVGCGACAHACPFDAIELGPFGQPSVVEAACKGCGVCAVECPVGGMQLRYFKDGQIMPAVEALLAPKWLDSGDRSEPVVLCFACRWCSYAAADLAGIMRLEYPANIRILLVPCSGRVDFRHIFGAFQRGADGVVVAGCLKEQCHYISGNLIEASRVEAAKRALDILGLDGDRLEMFFCSAGMPREFVQFLTEFTERVRKMGPAPIQEKKHGVDARDAEWGQMRMEGAR